LIPKLESTVGSPIPEFIKSLGVSMAPAEMITSFVAVMWYLAPAIQRSGVTIDSRRQYGDNRLFLDSANSTILKVAGL
jgi:hypothetical protein